MFSDWREVCGSQARGEYRKECEGVARGNYHRGAEFNRVTAAGKKLFLSLLVREEGKQSVVGMGAFLLDAARLPQTSLALDSIDGGEWGASDALCSFHYPLECFAVRNRAAAKPD